MGNRTRVRVVKNKISPPFTEAEFDILYGTGISQAGELVDIGAEAGIIDKSGSWYSYEGERIGQGRRNAINFLKENPDIYKAAFTSVKEVLGLAPKKAEAVQEGSEKTGG